MKPLALNFPPTGFLPDGVMDVGATAAGDGGGPDAGAPDAGGDAPEWTGPPVICLHGLVANGGNWGHLAGLLLGRGRAVAAPTYGNRGTAPVADNLAEVTAIIGATLARTGAGRVDLVGHSQGGLLAGLVVAGMLRGDSPVPLGAIRRVVSISGSHRGVAVPRLIPERLARAAAGDAAVDLMRLHRPGPPALARAVGDFLAGGGSADALPEWFELVSDADQAVGTGSTLTPDEYPGLTLIRLEDRLGRGVPHHRQPHDRGVSELVAELLAD